MSQLLTSLGSDSKLKTILMNNDNFERKCESSKRRRDSNAVMIRQFETGSSQVKRMTAIAEDNRRELKEIVQKHQQKTHCFLQDSGGTMAFVSSVFEKANILRTKYRSPDFDNPKLSIIFPSGDWIQKAESEQENLRDEVKKLSNKEEQLKADYEELKLRKDVVSKAMSKSEKDVSSLREEILRQETGRDNFLKTAAANKTNLQQATDEKTAEINKKTEADAEIIAVEKDLADLQMTVREKELEKENDKSNLESLHAKLMSATEFDPQIVSQLPDHDEINRIVDEWGAFNSTRKEQTAALPSLKVTVSETETVDSLQVVLESVRKQKQLMQSETEQLIVFKKQFIIADEMMSRKDSGYEAAVKQVEHNRNILNNLKVTAHAAKPAHPTKTRSRLQKETEALRLLEASNRDIPKGPSYRPLSEDYNTPRGAVHNELSVGKSNVQVMKHLSIESDFTRHVDTSGPHYPGIQILSQETKKINSNAFSEKYSPGEDDASPSMEDTSIQMDDTGTTQDESMMNGFFSPLKNNPVSREPSPVIEFSMADHMNDFNKRRAEKKNASNDVKPPQFDREDVSDDDDDADSSLIAPETDEDFAVIGSQEEDDEYDDLMAPEGQKDLNQSDWGSED